MWAARPGMGTPAPLAPGEPLPPLPCPEGQPPGYCCLPSVGAVLSRGLPAALSDFSSDFCLESHTATF